MVPMWTRAWRLANVYAYLALDLLFALLWFAATVALGVWQANGIKQGAKDHADDDADADAEGNCATWAYGSASKCKVAKAGVGFGVVVFLLWCLTSAISVWMVNKYRKTGVVPGAKNGGRGAFQPQPLDETGKDAWSTRIDEPDDEDGDGAPDDRRKYGQVPEYDEQEHGYNNGGGGAGLLRTTSDRSNLDVHPGRRSPMDSDARSTAPSGYEDGMAPSALSPTGVTSPMGFGQGYGQINPFANPDPYEAQQPGGRVQFPPANY